MKPCSKSRFKSPNPSSLMRSFMISGLLFSCFSTLPLSSAENSAEPPEKQADPSEGAKKEKAEWVLFNGKDLDGWKAHDAGGSGHIEVVDGAIRLGWGQPITGLIFEKSDQLPLNHYEVTWEARRISGTDFFASLTFPVEKIDQCLTLVVGGWGGTVVGISSLDGLDAYENNTCNVFNFKQDQWYQFKLRVSRDRIQFWIDDQKIFSEHITDRALSLRSGHIESYVPFSITSYDSIGEVKNLKVKPYVPDESEKSPF